MFIKCRSHQPQYRYVLTLLYGLLNGFLVAAREFVFQQIASGAMFATILHNVGNKLW